MSKRLERFYEILGRVAVTGVKPLKDLNGQSDIPQQGVYFFFTPGEFRSERPDQARVVRVGTHAIKKNAATSLWNRLKGHQGTADGGNHRGSVFRLHIGNALRLKTGRVDAYPHWGIGSFTTDEVRKAEVSLEREVSAELGRMGVAWIRVEDEAGPKSARAYLEANAIAILAATTKLDQPSADWLGRHSDKPEIRASGLWNIRHVNDPVDDGFLDLFEKYADHTLGQGPQPIPLAQYLGACRQAKG